MTAEVTYVHVAFGSAEINGPALGAGDGARITSEAMVSLKGAPGAEVLVFDLV